MPMSTVNRRLMDFAHQHADRWGWVSAYAVADELIALRDYKIERKRAEQIAYTTIRRYADHWNLIRYPHPMGIGIMGLWRIN